jgi:S1-C subfamily serine protease
LVDSPVSIPRAAAASLAFLRSEIPAEHPSAAVLGEERSGACVAVGPHHVLTAHYLVLGAVDVEVTGIDGRPRDVAQVTLDHDSGLALLTLSGPELRGARIGASEEIRPGAPVFLLTYAAEGKRKGAVGHVSSTGPFEAFWEYLLERALMTTALNPGLAGGPLFDATGALVGVVSLGLAAVGRFSLAIPIELYTARRGDLEQGLPGADARRAWAGIYPQGGDGSVVLSGVVPGGPAELAGLVPGDLILSVDGARVSSLTDLYRALWRRRTGDTVSFRILRDDALRVVEVAAGDRYAFYR